MRIMEAGGYYAAVDYIFAGFGIPLGVCATFIYLFILFGSFREKTGLGQLFIDISNAIAGWASGGPAKMAVITSALEGTVSGSSVANTVESGSLTIPMMKLLGYRPEFAAAVEASASTGGQIMPPIMGAAAFIMAEFLNMPYIDIAKAAIIPAGIGFFLAKMTWLERGVFFIGGLMLVDPGTMTDLAGILVLAIAGFYQWQKKRKDASQQFAGSI